MTLGKIGTIWGVDVDKWWKNQITPKKASNKKAAKGYAADTTTGAVYNSKGITVAQTGSNGSGGTKGSSGSSGSSGSGGSGGSSGSKSYTTSSGSSSGGGGTTTKTTKKTETYYERTTTKQDTVETTTITYKITKTNYDSEKKEFVTKTTLDNGTTITDIRLFDNSPNNKFNPTTKGFGLDDLFSECQWDTSDAKKLKKSKGAALTKNYTKDQFIDAMINNETPTNGSDMTCNNLGIGDDRKELGRDIGRVVLNNNEFSYIFGSYNDQYIYDPATDSYVSNNNPRNPEITYVQNDDSSEVTLTYYEDVIRPETNAEWMARVQNSERPSFAQIYKKLNDDEVINSISISTTSKFRDYMSQVWGTQNEDGTVTPLDLDKEAKNGDAKHVLTLFIDNITLHEAKHIPLFYPNVRMKFYHSNDKPDDVDTYNLRKIGAVIEYR